MQTRVRGHEVILQGLGISPGVSSGRICMANDARHRSLPTYTIQKTQVGREVERFHVAMAVAGRQLDDLIAKVSERVGPHEAAIFAAQKAVLQDPGVIRQILDAIDTEALNAEQAIDRVFGSYEIKLMAIENEVIRSRANDISEVRTRLLDVLGNTRPSLKCGQSGHCARGHHRIVAAVEVTPSMTVDLDAEHTLGFVSERGGRNSHAGILARSLGIPAVSGIDDLLAHINCGTEVIIDGDNGKVIIWPLPETVETYREREIETTRRFSVSEPISTLVVEANISVVRDAQIAMQRRTEGIGLYRTEFECMLSNEMLDEEQQYQRYKEVVSVLDGRPVTFRLFDFGADKPAPGRHIAVETNPCLGLRGSRYLLANRDLVRQQARAIARAAQHGPVRLLYPMIVDAPQFVLLRSIILEAIADLPPVSIAHGVMLELPSACLMADSILQEAAFASIGSNDLTQYLFGVDRDNHLVATDFQTDHPAFWSLIDTVLVAARRHGRPVGFCGEAATDPKVLRALMSRGISSVSVSPNGIARVRKIAKG